MFENLSIFRMSDAMARHASERTELTARNIANADTPGYRGERLPSFAESMARAQGTGPLGGHLRTTRPGHIGGLGDQVTWRASPLQTETSPNGNAVSIEAEMVEAAGAQGEHDRALAIYRHAMTVLRTVVAR